MDTSRGDTTGQQDDLRYFTKTEVAERLRFSVKTIDRMIKRGELECRDFVIGPRIPERSVRDYIERAPLREVSS